MTTGIPKQLRGAGQSKQIPPRLLRFMDSAEQALLLVHEQQHGVLWGDRLKARGPGRAWHGVVPSVRRSMRMERWLARSVRHESAPAGGRFPCGRPTMGGHAPPREWQEGHC